MVDGRHFVFSCGVGIDATVVKRVDAHPRLKSRAGPYYYSWAALSAFYRHYLDNPVRLRVETSGGDAGRGRHRPGPELRPVHLLRQPPDPGLRGGRDRRRHALAGRTEARRAARHADPDRPPLQRERPAARPPPDRCISTASPRPPITSISEDQGRRDPPLPGPGRRRLHRRARPSSSSRRPRSPDDRRLIQAVGVIR